MVEEITAELDKIKEQLSELFVGAGQAVFCLELQTLCVCLDSQVGEAVKDCPNHPGTWAQALYNLPRKICKTLEQC